MGFVIHILLMAKYLMLPRYFSVILPVINGISLYNNVAMRGEQALASHRGLVSPSSPTIETLLAQASLFRSPVQALFWLSGGGDS